MQFNYYSGPRYGMPTVTKNLLIINTLVWLFSSLPNFGHSMLVKLALFYPESPYFRIWQFFTYMFMHANFSHLFFNMFNLFMFGKELERMWGPKKYLFFYILCGIGSAAFHILIEYCQFHFFGNELAVLTPMIGASGAVFGVLLGYVMLFPDTRMGLFLIPITFKAKWFIIAYIVLELLFGIIGKDNIAHFAHLGGMLMGFILFMYWKRKHKLYSYVDWDEKL